MALQVLQGNLNHCARAQDLLVQSMAEWSINLAVVAEPYFVPSRDNWVGDPTGSVAIISSVGATMVLINRRPGCVAAAVEGVLVVGVYFSPNRVLAEFESFLGDMGALIGQNRTHPVLLLGDLNAKSRAWGCPASDARGDVLEEWAVCTGLEILNRGTVYTCVRHNGGSIVDVSFASPSIASRIRRWRVLEGVETLSDHRYIRFELSTRSVVGSRSESRNTSETPRWVLNKMDRDVLIEAAIVQAWVSNEPPVDVHAAVAWFRHAMSQICDAAMPRARAHPQRRQVYWWSQTLARMRAECATTRRLYTRSRRRRRRDRTREAQLYEAYKTAKAALQLSISQAKDAAWEEFLELLNRDPWGRPYKLARAKLRPWAPPLTETLDPSFLHDVVSALFPNRAVHTPPTMGPLSEEPSTETEAPEVTEAELGLAELRMRAKNKAPGPDGVPGGAWALALKVLAPRLRQLFTACLRQGHFPDEWKMGRLVLLKKEGRPTDSPSAYRPIVLLDEVGKLFERIIAARLGRHMMTVGPDLSDNQFGFRVGRSTVDAILRVKAHSEQAVAEGGVLLAVSLDVSNAFNTLPWGCILEALRYHQMPPHLRRIVGDYLRNRSVMYMTRDGVRTREMSCGVPQGSVLGPLLWNIGYDWVLRGANLPGVSVICYADDTLLLARERSFRESARLATAGVAQVVARIRTLGLEVALNKTEAVCFHGPRKVPPVGSHITIGGVRIEVKQCMRYLGLMLDGRWRFETHFQLLAPRLMNAAGALGRLLPNLGGPNNICRRLYMGVIRSMALYGAPVWAIELTSRGTAILRRPQRAICIRVIRGYRTISAEAACALARSLPWDLDARVLASLYTWRKDARDRGVMVDPRELEQCRAHLQRAAVAEWVARLERPGAGIRTVEALRPVLEEWVERRHGVLTFRLTQVLSGHGCFGQYLCRIAGREPDARCHHCGGLEDTAQHTLAECNAWAEQRRVLDIEIGADLSLPVVIASMVRSETAWQAVASFCEEVIATKETAEREREIASNLPIRARRTRRRNRADNALFQPP